MIEAVRSFLHDQAVFCLLLSIVLGAAIGRIHVKGVGLGNVVGTLFAGLVVGVLASPSFPDEMRWLFFYLFLFSIGYSVSPQLFGSSLKQALPQMALSVVVAIFGLGSALGMVMLFGFDEGLAVGIFSGALTHSAGLGTGISAINELPISTDAKAALSANAPLGDAITYGFGDLGMIVFLTWLGPRLMRVNLKAEAKRLEQLLGGDSDEHVFLGAYYALRALRVEHSSVAGMTVEQFERSAAAARLSVQRVRRDGRLLDVTASLTLARGDEVVVAARRGAFLDLVPTIGSEIDASDLLAIPIKTASVVVTRDAFATRTLADLARDPQFRGVYLESVQRGAERLPREPGVTMQRGDILRVVGSPADVDRAGALIGFVEREVSRTDLAFLAGGICCGLILALAKVDVGGVAVGLGAAGSILIVGVLGGWLRTRYPAFGVIPEPAQRLLTDLGLTVFVGLVGLQAGPHAIEAYHSKGGEFFAQIFVSGVVVTVVPIAAAALVGRFLLRLNPVMLIGGICGAQTCTPGLAALRESADSDVVSLAYAVPYAVSSILLTMCAPILVAIVHLMRG